ncbi:MAG: type II secretion system protein [bacterium]|nr:type II secretion system protein [bacterium]
MKGFTLAEVLITLAIIGVVAAMSIPSVISNSQQQEFKTGLRKAVSVLNSAIAVNMAIDGESPYDNADTFGYLTRHMSVLKTTSKVPWKSSYERWDGSEFNSVGNAAFYTTDGMRFETDDNRRAGGDYDTANGMLKLHESDV